MSKVSQFKVGHVYRVQWLAKAKDGSLLHSFNAEDRSHYSVGCTFRGECKQTGEVMLRFVFLKPSKVKGKSGFGFETDPNAPILTTTAVRCKGEGFGEKMEVAPYWNFHGQAIVAFVTSNGDLPSDKVLKKIKPVPFGS
jgi:hypothetical protein